LAAGFRGWVAVSTETTDFIKGASYAFLLAGLCWALIGVAVYRLVLL
jgi:hypothetical protein